MFLRGRIRKKSTLPCLFPSFCLNRSYEQCTLVTKDDHIVKSHIMLNMSTFSRLWTKQFWTQHPDYNSLNVKIDKETGSNEMSVLLDEVNSDLEDDIEN